MKKLIFVAVVLFSLSLMAGCGTQRKTIRYNSKSADTAKVDIIDENSEEIKNEEADELDENSEEVKNEEADNITGLSEIKKSEKEAIALKLEKEIQKIKPNDPKIINPDNNLQITSFDGDLLETKFNFNVVKGKTASNTHKITINDYQLKKYISGRTQWDYIASTKFNTLKNGLNDYVVKTFDKDGNQIDSINFSINYDAPVAPKTLPSVGFNHYLILILSFLNKSSRKDSLCCVSFFLKEIFDE